MINDAKNPGIAGIVNVIDDDVVLLQMMQDLISTIDVKVLTFSSARQFLAEYRPSPCECLICDIRMPEINGLDLQKHLNGMKIAIPTIFISGFAEVEIAVMAMKHGAFDFLEKPFSKQLLLGKVQAALDASRMNFRQSRQDQTREARLALLSARERSVIELVMEGKTSKEISEQLDIKLRTVESHRSRIFEKLHVKSTVELIKLFL
jgi:FixJ family two-component response regulator